MHISGLKKSNFLTKEDVGAGILVTIKELTEANVAMQGQPEEMKHVLCFKETEKPMVLNMTNGELIAAVCGSEETDEWTGKKIVLYVDASVMMHGKMVGGIRARAPRIPKAGPAVVNPPKPTPVVQEEQDDIPF